MEKQATSTKGNIYTISGPSGSGKTTLVNRLTGNRLTTTTTRKPRPNEVDGKDYFFVDKEHFEKMIKDGALVEWAKYGEKENLNYYGVTKTELEKKLIVGDVFAIVDVQGMRSYKEIFSNTTSIFIYASYDEVRKQLLDRGGDEIEQQRRLDLYQEEMKFIYDYDYVLENKYGKVDETVETLKKLINENAV